SCPLTSRLVMCCTLLPFTLPRLSYSSFFFFFFNDPPPPDFYPLPLPDALPILARHRRRACPGSALGQLEREFARLGRGDDGRDPEFVVGLELGPVVELLERGVTGIGRMTRGVGADVPRRLIPPAELADPDLPRAG